MLIDDSVALLADELDDPTQRLVVPRPVSGLACMALHAGKNPTARSALGVELSEAERRVFCLVDGEANVAEVARHACVRIRVVTNALQALVEFGLVLMQDHIPVRLKR